MKLTFTKELPKKPGYYWWTNFGEHTPTILEVRKDYSDGGKLWASNEEFSFKIERINLKKLKKENAKYELETVDGYQHGEELWCYIPNPFLPSGTQVEPDSY